MRARPIKRLKSSIWQEQSAIYRELELPHDADDLRTRAFLPHCWLHGEDRQESD